MSKLDEKDWCFVIATWGALGGILAFVGKRVLRVFGTVLFCLAVLELVVASTPIGDILWYVHAPSVLVLGVDEILERHGRFISAAGHFCDLILWAIVITLIVASLKKRCDSETQIKTDTE